MPLTDAFIRKIKPTDKPQRLFDGGGLYLEVAPSGGKWWRLKYRVEGKEKRISLGVYPDTGLAEARAAREEARRKLAAKIDPSAARKAEAEARKRASLNSLEAVARAWLEHMSGKWKAGTREAVLASLTNHVLPVLGAKPIKDILPAEIRAVVKAVEAAGAAETAGRVFQRLRAIFRYAVAHDLCETDPTYPLKPSEIFKPRKVRHRPSLPEGKMPDFLRKLDDYQGEPSTVGALRLLLLTATRPGETRGAQWEEFDETKAIWRIPGERMKMETPHLVPLSTQALQLLRELRQVSGGGELVFPSPFYPRKPISDGTMNSALARMGYKGLATAHGFRTVFSTKANETGWNADVIERQLAHEERDEVRGAYNRAQWITERTRLMQWWGDQLDRLRAAGATDTKIGAKNYGRGPHPDVGPQ
jgi:integrase